MERLKQEIFGQGVRFIGYTNSLESSQLSLYYSKTQDHQPITDLVQFNIFEKYPSVIIQLLEEIITEGHRSIEFCLQIDLEIYLFISKRQGTYVYFNSTYFIENQK